MPESSNIWDAFVVPDEQADPNETAIPLHVYNAWQGTFSIYNQSSIYLDNKTSLGIGARLQKSKIAIGDNLDNSAPDYAGWQKQPNQKK